MSVGFLLKAQQGLSQGLPANPGLSLIIDSPWAAALAIQCPSFSFLNSLAWSFWFHNTFPATLFFQRPNTHPLLAYALSWPLAFRLFIHLQSRSRQSFFSSFVIAPLPQLLKSLDPLSFSSSKKGPPSSPAFIDQSSESSNGARCWQRGFARLCLTLCANHPSVCAQGQRTEPMLAGLVSP